MSSCAGDGCTHPECTARRDPILKYDGRGQAIRLSQAAAAGMNRAERRAAARKARRR